MSDALAYPLDSLAAEQPSEHRLARTRPTLPLVYPTWGKRLLDLGLLLLAAPFVLPLMALLALLIRASGGPAFFAQDRLGQGGRVFRFWKLRTMVVEAEAALERHLSEDSLARAEWERHQKLTRDPRVTRIGQILRATSLDELPQLWNVLRGDMSLVGPRPMLPQQEALYPGKAYLHLRPGLTGRWQVGERHTSTFADRARADDQYAAELSLLTDLRIMAATFWVVVKGTGR